VRARIPGHYERKDEVVECTPLGYALLFVNDSPFAAKGGTVAFLPRLRSGARVVFFGAKTSSRPPGWLLNPLLRRVFPNLTFQSTPVPDVTPWAVLAPQLADFEILEYFFGWLFLASGTYRAQDVQAPRRPTIAEADMRSM